MAQLQGKVALVTGASRGIGRAIALRLAHDGAKVAIHYGVRREEAEKTVQMIEANGGTAFAIGAPLDSTDGVKALFDTFEAELIARTGQAQFDILVNNAGIVVRSSFEETDEAAYDDLFAVNVKAPFFLTQKALPYLRENGRIINVSSGATRIAMPGIIAYSLTKGAINTFTLTLARHLGPRCITVNALLVGIVDTEMNAGWLHEQEAQKYASALSTLGRIGQVDDIADIAAFLASPDSRWITGQLIDATGGSQL